MSFEAHDGFRDRLPTFGRTLCEKSSIDFGIAGMIGEDAPWRAEDSTIGRRPVAAGRLAGPCSGLVRRVWLRRDCPGGLGGILRQNRLRFPLPLSIRLLDVGDQLGELLAIAAKPSRSVAGLGARIVAMP